MLIATFGPATAWVGKTITYADGQFVLEGYGAVAPDAVLEYDRQGLLTWDNDGLRKWVQRLANAPRPIPKATGVSVPKWLLVVLGCAAVALIIGLIAAVAVPVLLNQHEKARVMMVKAGVRSIHAGLEAFADEHSGYYPVASVVTKSGLGRFVGDWPTNPYTDEPMSQGSGPGEFKYRVYDNGLSFDLDGYVANGTAIIQIRRVAEDGGKTRAIENNIHTIQVAVESWAIDHDGEFPDVNQVTSSGLSHYADQWPINPYTGLAMTQGVNQGDYLYSASPDRRQYKLVGYGNDGVVMVQVP